MKKVIAVILVRAEGRTDDLYWAPGQARAFSGPYCLPEAEDTLSAVARRIDHPGYDKFDIEFVMEDGSRSQGRIDVHKDEDFDGQLSHEG